MPIPSIKYFLSFLYRVSCNNPETFSLLIKRSLGNFIVILFLISLEITFLIKITLNFVIFLTIIFY